jgi:hypothetical protein
MIQQLAASQEELSSMQLDRFTRSLCCVCLPHAPLNQFTNFDEMWYETYATGSRPNVVLLCFLQSVVRTWRT